MPKLILKRKSGTPAISQRKQKPVSPAYSKPDADMSECAYALEVFIKACGTLAEASRFLDVSKQHVHQWRQRGAMGKFSADLVDKVPLCLSKGFSKEFLRPDLTADQWALVAKHQPLIGGQEQKLEHMKQYDIDLLDHVSAEEQLKLDPPKSETVQRNLRGTKENLK